MHIHVHDELELKQDVAMAQKNKEFTFPSTIRGLHVYRRVWVPHVGQGLSCEREDKFTVGQEMPMFKNHSWSKITSGQELLVVKTRLWSRTAYGQESLLLSALIQSYTPRG